MEVILVKQIRFYTDYPNGSVLDGSIMGHPHLAMAKAHEIGRTLFSGINRWRFEDITFDPPPDNAQADSGTIRFKAREIL